MTPEFKVPTYEEVAAVEAAARLERSIATRAMFVAFTTWVVSKFSSKTNAATA